MIALITVPTEALHSMNASVYTGHKPKGPVLQNTTLEEVATPTVKRGFVMPRFSASVRSHLMHMVSGQMGLSARLTARLRACFEHLPHPLRFKTQTVDHLGSLEGIQTMTAITARKSAPATTANPATIPTDRLTTVLAAFNAANIASSYIERGNFAAARRKLVQALASVNQLQAEV